MIHHLTPGATKDMVIMASSGAYNIKKVCKNLANFIQQAGTSNSVHAAYTLCYNKTKEHTALPNGNPYLTKNMYKTPKSNDMANDRKRTTPLWIDMMEIQAKKAKKMS
jgi:hypothetical protein